MVMVGGWPGFSFLMPMVTGGMRSGSGILDVLARLGWTRGWIWRWRSRVDWAEWMTQEVQDADRVLVIASPAYKRRAEGDAGPAEGRGVQWEARLIRDLFYADQQAGLRRFVPVVLPGCSQADIPVWLSPASATHYQVDEFTVAGAEDLLRVLTGQPGVLSRRWGRCRCCRRAGGGAGRAWRGRRSGRGCIPRS